MRAIAAPFYHQDGIRTYAICAGTVRTNLMDSPVWDTYPEEHITPVETIVSAIEKFVARGRLEVIGIDISEAQLESAKRLSTDAVFNPVRDSGYQVKIKEMTNGGCQATAIYSASNKAYQVAPATLR